MLCRILNTENMYDNNNELDYDYLEIVKGCFGEPAKRYVYRDLNDEDFKTQYFVEVKSLEQLLEFQGKVGKELIIANKNDEYVYIKEVDKFVYLEKNKNPQILVVEIYDGCRE